MDGSSRPQAPALQVVMHVVVQWVLAWEQLIVGAKQRI